MDSERFNSLVIQLSYDLYNEKVRMLVEVPPSLVAPRIFADIVPLRHDRAFLDVDPVRFDERIHTISYHLAQQGYRRLCKTG